MHFPAWVAERWTDNMVDGGLRRGGGNVGEASSAGDASNRRVAFADEGAQTAGGSAGRDKISFFSAIGEASCRKPTLAVSPLLHELLPDSPGSPESLTGATLRTRMDGAHVCGGVRGYALVHSAPPSTELPASCRQGPPDRLHPQPAALSITVVASCH